MTVDMSRDRPHGTRERGRPRGCGSSATAVSSSRDSFEIQSVPTISKLNRAASTFIGGAEPIRTQSISSTLSAIDLEKKLAVFNEEAQIAAVMSSVLRECRALTLAEQLNFALQSIAAELQAGSPQELSDRLEAFTALLQQQRGITVDSITDFAVWSAVMSAVVDSDKSIVVPDRFVREAPALIEEPDSMDDLDAARAFLRSSWGQ